jgi:hypothetical protein
LAEMQPVRDRPALSTPCIEQATGQASQPFAHFATLI